MQKSYNTLSEAIDGLKIEGYSIDFSIFEEYIAHYAKKKLLPPEDFEIDLIYRFEGMSNPDDQSILYAISSNTHQVKGILVNGYGISADTEINDVISRIQYHATAKSG